MLFRQPLVDEQRLQHILAFGHHAQQPKRRHVQSAGGADRVCPLHADHVRVRHGHQLVQDLCQVEYCRQVIRAEQVAACLKRRKERAHSGAIILYYFNLNTLYLHYLIPYTRCISMVRSSSSRHTF